MWDTSLRLANHLIIGLYSTSVHYKLPPTSRKHPYLPIGRAGTLILSPITPDFATAVLTI